jgi:hypothetical protein
MIRWSEWVSEWEREWVSECEWESEWEWVSERVSGWVREWVGAWVRGWVSGGEWVSERVSEWVWSYRIGYVEICSNVVHAVQYGIFLVTKPISCTCKVKQLWCCICFIRAYCWFYSTVEPVYNDIGLYDISPVESDIVSYQLIHFNFRLPPRCW